MGETINIPINKIKPRRALRVHVDNADLMKSMREHGQYTPVQVETCPGGYRLLNGLRRLDCARELGWETIKAVIVDF